MFDPDDPRSGLVTTTTQPGPAVAASGSQYARFYERAAAIDEGVPTWWVRGQHIVVAYSDVNDGATFTHAGLPDEWMVLAPASSTSLRIESGDETLVVAGDSLTILPPGDVTLHVAGRGQLVRLFPATCVELAARASNADEYCEPRPAVAEFERWPAPVDGYRVRTYSLDVPADPERFGRIWRCSTIMVNYLDPVHGPRDSAKLSPHNHADFEQISLALSGDYVHHLRWPWGVNLAEWRADEHERCAAPSIAVIPPPSIHTSQAIGGGLNQLIDIFAPPRDDFSLKCGWVLNAEEYPLPTRLGEG